MESTGLLRDRNHRSVLLSITIQACIASLLLSIPLVHPELLPLHAPALFLIAPPMPKPVPPPPPLRERVHVEHATLATLPTPAASTLLPTGSTHSHLGDTISSTDAPYSGPIDITGSGPASLPSALNSSGPARAVVASSRSGARTRISSGVSTGLLLEPIRPVYPAIAKIARIEGTVVVQAIISRGGAIESAHVLTGPAMLQAAALEAVEKAHYRPYLLNGEPTEVDTTFSIVFHLGSN